VNDHMLVAVYVMLAMAGLWCLSQRAGGAWVPVVAVSLGAISIGRPEGPLLAAVVAIPGMTSPGIPLRERALIAGGYAGVTAVWYGLGVAVHLDGGLGNSVVLGALVGVVSVAGATVAGAWPRLRRLTDAVPVVMPALALLAVVPMAVHKPGLVRQSISATTENVLGRGLWEATWIALPFLVVGAAIATRLGGRSLWVAPVATFPPFVLGLAYLRDKPYRVGPGDSASRMMMHILLAAVSFLVLAALHATSRTATTRSTSTGSCLREALVDDE